MEVKMDVEIGAASTNPRHWKRRQKQKENADRAKINDRFQSPSILSQTWWMIKTHNIENYEIGRYTEIQGSHNNWKKNIYMNRRSSNASNKSYILNNLPIPNSNQFVISQRMILHDISVFTLYISYWLNSNIFIFGLSILPDLYSFRQSQFLAISTTTQP